MDAKDIERLAKEELREEAHRASINAAKERIRRQRKVRAEWWVNFREGFPVGVCFGAAGGLGSFVLFLLILIAATTHH